MSHRRIPTWLLLSIVAAGLPLVAIPALWVIVSITATPLHPNPNNVTAVRHSPPLPKWADAVEQARQIARAGVAEQNLPGLSVAIGVNGEVVWAEGFGFADLRNSVPVTPDHRFRIGTASTVLTSAAVGHLLENGRLKLDDEIQTYVPAFPKKEWPVTLGQLAGHTAGVMAEGGDAGPLITKHCERPVEALKYFAENPLMFKPGTQHRYSSFGWILVSTAVEAAAERPLLAFMREKIFDPLGMRDTVPDPAPVEPDDDFPIANLIRELIFDPRVRRDAAADATKKSVDGRVTSYFPRFASDPNYGMHLMRPIDYSCYSGSSVFVSTPSDLVRFGMAINGGKILQPATVARLQTSQRLASGQETEYGLGWSIKTVTLAGKQTRMIGHDGDSLGGRVASLMTFPEHGIVIALTSNISHADTPAIGLKIAGAFLEKGLRN